MNLEDMLGQRIELSRFYMALTQLFAMVGLTLAAVGVYAVTGYMVHRRRHELAVRVAMGAAPRRVFGHIATSGFAVILAGIAIGSLVAWFARRLIAAPIVSRTAISVTSFGFAAGVVILAAGAAVLVGALRAIRSDPCTAGAVMPALASCSP